MLIFNKKESPKQAFRRGMYNLLKKYGIEASEKAKDELLSYLKTNAKLNQKMIDKVIKIISDRYIKSFKTRKKRHASYYKAYYPTQRYRYQIRKGEPAYVSYDLQMIDKRSISLMTKADLVWFYEHANTNFLSQFVQSIMLENIEAGLSGYEIAGVLKSQFANYTPVQYAKMFGEAKYWQLVTNNNTLRVSSTANINSMVEAGITQYMWLTRESERTCPICNALHEKIFEVDKARDQIVAYENAAENGDIEGMKEASQFLDLKDVENIDAFDGLVPPVHHACECDIVVV